MAKVLSTQGNNLWYLVGLITSEGSLSKDSGHINITSKEYDFLNDLKTRLDLKYKIGTKNRGKINQAYQIQIANVKFCNFRLSIGLFPNKSLTLQKINVPDKFFAHFLRGIIDGDGSIRSRTLLSSSAVPGCRNW